MNAILDVTENQALDGAIKFNVPFSYGNDWVMLRSGCFAASTARPVGFWIDHQESLTVGSTDDALTLVIDDDGIQFRLDLGRCKLGPVIARMCSTNNRASMSVGCDVLNEHQETIDGKLVRVVTRARLNELTLCKEGCASDAFAMVVDKTVTPKPVAGSRSPTLQAGQKLHRVSRAVKKLKAQVLATYGDAKPVRVRRFSVEESNRWQTEETERLQTLARRTLFR